MKDDVRLRVSSGSALIDNALLVESFGTMTAPIGGYRFHTTRRLIGFTLAWFRVLASPHVRLPS